LYRYKSYLSANLLLMETNKLHGYLHSAAFLAGVAVIAWYFNYADIAKLGPFSLHNWRQADSASLARCYYENGMHFFQPKVHHVLGGANAAVGEFPILYYIAAGLYHIFGPHDVILRLLVFGCFTAGLWAWSKILLRWVGDWRISLTLPWAFYGSPLLAFYGFNFLPNPAGLGLALVGLYGLLRYWEQPGRGRLIFAGAFFLAAALIKVSLLVVPLAAVAAAKWFYFFAKGDRAKYFPDKSVFWNWMGAVTVILVATAAWYLWASHYNKTNHSGLLMTYIMPIWKMPKAEIERYAYEIYMWYHSIYFNKFTILAFLALLPAVLVMPRQFPRPAYAFTVFVLLGSLAFLVLFYNQILVHHYYIIDIMPLVMAVFSLTVWKLKNWLPSRLSTRLLGIALSIFALVSISYGKKHLSDYYGNDQYIAPFNRSFTKQKELHAFMAEKGLTYDSTLAIVVPDLTPNVNLYYLNVKGWATRPDEPFSNTDLERYALWRGTTLVVSDTAYLSRPDMEKWLAHPIGVFDGTIYFYDIRPYWE
jgi:hypothetical protein